MNSIRLAWWNTSLSPNRDKERASEISTTIAFNTIQNLLKEESVDFLALGEISQFNMPLFAKFVDEGGYNLQTSFVKSGRYEHNMAFIYKGQNLQIDDEILEITAIRHGNLVKVAKSIKATAFGNLPFKIYVSHWSSRLWVPEGSPLRHKLAIKLRDEINSQMDEDATIPIVLMGDFNDEPFDISFSDQLESSRSIAMVKKRSTLLYNPFWKALSHYDLNDGPYNHGTYFWNKGVTEDWLTFDQILISSNCIEGPVFAYNEDGTGVYSNLNLVEAIESDFTHFDHLPVYLTLTRTV